MAKKEKPMSAQHIRFVSFYRQLRNATRAYMATYPRASESSANTLGPQLMRNIRISSEIERLDNEALKRAQMGPDEALAETAHLARFDAGAYYWAEGELDSHGQATEPGTVKPLREMSPEVRRTIKSIKRDILGNVEIVPWDKTGPLKTILQHHKLLTDRVEFGVDSSFGDMLEDARRKLEGEK